MSENTNKLPATVRSVSKSWDVLNTNIPNDNEKIIDLLLESRGILTKKEKLEFLNPKFPNAITAKSLGIDLMDLKKAIARIKKAIQDDERIIIYGDYDADGVCATAIMWETVFRHSKKVLPYIPDRSTEGYGINPNSISLLKEKYPELSLIITVDNGIVANDAIDTANKLGLDVILSDHHQKSDKIPKAYSIIHTDKISGAGISWILSREITKALVTNDTSVNESLDLAAIGTIADQMPLVKENRTLAKYGLIALNQTKRIGLNALYNVSGLKKGEIGTYEINYQIAPRINAMGRLTDAMDSLRLMCTNLESKAKELAQLLQETNLERQKVVEEVIKQAKQEALKREWQGVLVVAHDTFHEGVIGLAASKLVEEYWLPTIVIAKGESVSKASARSIPGFNIIEAIRFHSDLIIGGGGHPMAAGFSIANANIENFIEKIHDSSLINLTSDVRTRKLKADTILNFNQINNSLYKVLANFNPTGIGNSSPTFVTKDVDVVDTKPVGKEGKHIKFKIQQEEERFNAIGFNMSDFLNLKGSKVDVMYTIEENTWNGNSSLELKIKDIKNHD